MQSWLKLYVKTQTISQHKIQKETQGGNEDCCWKQSTRLSAPRLKDIHKPSSHRWGALVCGESYTGLIYADMVCI